LWHGASWTFVVYGALHGIAISYEALTKKFRKNLSKKIPSVIYNPLSVFLTFTFCSVAWIYFRATSFKDANYIITHLFSRKIGQSYFEIAPVKTWGVPDMYLGVPLTEFFGTLSLIPLLLLLERLLNNRKNESVIGRMPATLRWPVYYFVIFTLVFLGVYSKNNFIYFQF